MRTVVGMVVIGVLILDAVWFAALLIGETRLREAAHEPWPLGLGPLASVPSRYPSHGTTPAATRLTALAAVFGIPIKSAKPDSDFAALEEYVRHEQEKATRSIAPPPDAVAAFLASRTHDIDALRDHLLHGGALAWEVDLARGWDAPLPNLLLCLQAVRLLVARSLVTGSWDDLHAANNLGRALEARPEVVSQLIRLSIARMVIAAAWKLPVPAPAWLDEANAVDSNRLMIVGMQHDTWEMWRHAQTAPFASFLVARPYADFALASYVRAQRDGAVQLTSSKNCRIDGAAFERARLARMPGWNPYAKDGTYSGTAWQRERRFIAEREAAANAMRIMQGQSIVTRSQCADGAWRFDGKTLAFSIDLPRAGPQERPMPLALHPRE